MVNMRLVSMVPGARWPIIACVVLQWVALVANIILMLCLGGCIQGLVSGGAVDLMALPITGAIAIIIRITCLTLAQRSANKAAVEARRTIRTAVFAKLVDLGPSFGANVPTAKALQVCGEGCEQLETYFGSYLPQLPYALLAPMTLFAFLAPLCWKASVVLLLCMPLIPISIAGVQTIAKRTMGEYWDSYTDLGHEFLQNLRGLTTLKVFHTDDLRHDRMNLEAETFRQATMRLLRMQLNSVTLMDAFAYGGAAAGMGTALMGFAAGDASFMAAFAFVLLSAEFFIPLRMLGSFFHTAMSGAAAARTMFEILDAPGTRGGTRAVPSGAVSIECEGMGFSYDGRARSLDDVDFQADAGAIVGIAGMSGSGKSTFAGVLAGRNTGYTGSIRVNGVELSSISDDCLASTVTTVPFESHLFAGTIRTNLQMARPSADDDELWDVLRRSRAEGFVRDVGGLDAPVTEGATNLSGGQRQRIALARALLHDSAVYVFDEVTSNVDAESEEAILETIREVARTRTVIVVSHRLASLADARCIYVFEAGRVVEKGTHRELLESGGPYAGMWRTQEALIGQDASPASQGSAGEDGGRGSLEGHHDQDGEVEGAFQGAGGVSQPRDGMGTIPGQAGDGPARSKASIMVRLLGLARPLAPFLCLAVVLGSAGFLAASFLTVFATYALLDAAGFPQATAFWPAMALMVGCALLRGPLHYGEQLCNHYAAYAQGVVPADQAILALVAVMSSFGPVVAVANLGSTLQPTLAAGDRVLAILDEEPVTPEVRCGEELAGYSGSAMRDVDFSYGDEVVLHGADFKLEPGETVRIAGPSGAGKSTVCKLLMRFWDPARGTVSINGCDLRQVETASLRAVETCMMQDTFVFDGTLRQNLLVARPEASDDELMEACRKASLTDFIAGSDEGLDRSVGPWGEALSGGERQRLGLARAFLTDARLVLLDEPTSNLDSLNEAVVLRGLEELGAQRTLVLVSHRATTAALARRTVWLSGGRLVSEGQDS